MRKQVLEGEILHLDEIGVGVTVTVFRWEQMFSAKPELILVVCPYLLQ
jgi:hypothetical protein